MTKSDSQLKKDVESELEWDASVKANNIGVAIKDGVVTLSGHLDSFAEKYAAERAVQRVQGVKGLAVELDVRLGAAAKRTDADLASAAESALRWHALVPEDRVKVMVEKGWVTLSGEVDWDYQRNYAMKAVRPLIGVLERQADREAKNIEVIVSGHTATLKGQVHSWAERTAAQGAAWSAPGITSVINELRVV
jgi:osmotically-inducible protein OsmY